MDALRRRLEVNVVGVVRMSQLVLPAMRARNSGRIITIGSVGGLLANMPDTGEDSPHALFKDNLDSGVRKLFQPGSRAVVSADRVARIVAKAATARHPRPRYKVGAVAHILPRARHLIGDRGWDAIARRQFAAE